MFSHFFPSENQRAGNSLLRKYTANSCMMPPPPPPRLALVRGWKEGGYREATATLLRLALTEEGKNGGGGKKEKKRKAFFFHLRGGNRGRLRLFLR